MDAVSHLRRARFWLILFIIGLVLSGLTAFPLRWEVGILYDMTRHPAFGWLPVGLVVWIARVHEGLTVTYARYPFIAYGTDWLAFAHLVIAIAFLGPLKDPVRNVWVVQFGMITCALVLPLALIAGPLRGIPFYWQLIDCAFGVIGIVPLWLAYREIRMLANKV
jgi:hypothetical protein